MKGASWFFAAAAGVYVALAVDSLFRGLAEPGLDYFACACFCAAFGAKAHSRIGT